MRRGSLALSGLAVLVLVGVVAVASTGSTPSGTTEGRRPSDLLLDTFFSLALLALIPGAVLLVYGLTRRKEIQQELASRRYPRTSLAAYLVFMLLFTVIVYFGYRNSTFPFLGSSGEVTDPGRDEDRVAEPGGRDTDVYEAEFAWIPVLIVLALAAIAVAAFVLASRRNALRRTEDAVLAEDLADVLDETLDDLRAEPDPRRAVIAAFARLERAFAASGLPRFEAETADEYAARVLAGLAVDRRAVGRLADLFAQAKFSQHEIDQRMKDDAIDALAQVRDELRAAAEVAVDAVQAPRAPREAASP
jgi:Domain of unknown function (DUF4129)